MKINELAARQTNVNLEFQVVDKGPIREFNKFGKSGRVSNANVMDDTGRIKLTLWNDECDRISAGDKVKLTDGYVNEYQGELQLTTGRAGKLEVIGKGEAVPSAGTQVHANNSQTQIPPTNPSKSSEPEDDDDYDDDGPDDIEEEFIDY